MAPMTRSRADAAGVVGELTVLYYTQRASAGLIVTEAINISKQGQGSPFTPGLYTQAQVDAWKKVTQAVHAKGGFIYAQLWHTGRVGHSVDRNGELPVAPSAIAIAGQQHYTSQGLKDFEVPRALTVAEIKDIVRDYATAAKNAIEAGFDGVEFHGANGYLPSQFLADNANVRTDAYGGSVENRSRFYLEAVDALIGAVGGERVGVRISPTNPYNGILHEDPVAQFTHLIGELNKRSLAYVHLMNNNPMFPQVPHYPTDVVGVFGKQVRHLLIANTAYTRESGEAELQKGVAKMIAYGSLFLANPDLPRRFELDAPLNQPDFPTFFAGGERGYTDYASLEA